eukprot:TRINITY_DN30515_c0_g1_i1.p1 TRINITY_DN30515_c0_g1~~TRINITY_DN30515_c0_g1_i1.p1  ORF type:complete len:861 (+),score=163.21 TRINITY_DN30515_c0_g1_i1:55-2637(+)
MVKEAPTKEESEGVTASVSGDFFDIAKRVKEAGEALEKAVRENSSEREIWDEIQFMTSGDAKLAMARGYLGVVVTGLLHLQYKVTQKEIPQSVPGPTTWSQPGQIGLTPVDAALRWLTIDEKQEAEKLFTELIDTVHPTYLIPALLSARAITQDPFKGISMYPKHLSDLLDRVVVRFHGIRVLADTLLTGVPETEEGGYSRIVNAVAKCPSTIHTSEQHYRLLAPQVQSLWSDLKTWRAPHFHTFVPLLMVKLTEKHLNLSRKHLIRPMVKPFLMANKHEAVQVAESVERMHRMIFEVRKDMVFTMFGEFMGALLKMHASVFQSALLVKNALFEVLQKLVNSDPEKSRLVLLSHILSAAASHGIKGLPMLSTDAEGYYFTPSPTGGVCISYGTIPPVDSVSAIVHLLCSLSEKSHLPGDLLMDLLSEHKSNPTDTNILTLACRLIEKLGVKCLKNGDQAITLVLFLLQLRSGDDNDEMREEEDPLEGMTIGLSLLELALTDKLIVSVDRRKIIELKEVVGKLNSPEPEIGQMIAGCKLGLNRLDARLNKEENTETVHKSSEELLTSIFGDLTSTETAFKGHALIALKHFVLEQTHRETTLSNFSSIFDAFTAYVNDTESFLFLPAINGLVAMSDAFSEMTLPFLLEHYRPYVSEEERKAESIRKARMRKVRNNGKYESRPKLQLRDHRLLDKAAEEDRVVKLCDVLVYCVWRAGEGLRPGVAEALLQRCHARETELVRASAMQGLASLATHSIWSLSEHLDTVCQLTFDVIALDKSKLCRRGAASLLYHLLCGLGHHAITMIEVHLPKILDLARGHLRDPDAVFGEYFRLLLEEANSIRLNIHNAPERSLFSKSNSINVW